MKNLLLLLALVCIIRAHSNAADAPRPNIIFILADDMGWGDPNCYGNSRIQTPNLDRLAKQGTLFEQFYVCGSVCSPSRAAFMTGQFPARLAIINSHRMKLHVLLVLSLCGITSAAPLAIETTLVDADALSYGTFQSNNQKVVRNSRGIFMTHLHSRNEKYTAQQWRLSWSKDGGKTFRTLCEATGATNPPVLETDSADNLYIGRPDWVSTEVLLCRFLAADDYREPHITRVPKTAAGKYSMEIDEKRGQVCYFSHSGWFIRFGLDGALRSSTFLLKSGTTAVQEYTHLHLADDGTLHAAWTSLNIPKHLYWGIHHLQSSDGGETWRAFTTKNLALPILADETGKSVVGQFENRTD